MKIKIVFDLDKLGEKNDQEILKDLIELLKKAKEMDYPVRYRIGGKENVSY